MFFMQIGQLYPYMFNIHTYVYIVYLDVRKDSIIKIGKIL